MSVCYPLPQSSHTTHTNTNAKGPTQSPSQSGWYGHAGLIMPGMLPSVGRPCCHCYLIAFLEALPEGWERRGQRYPQWMLLLMANLRILSQGELRVCPPPVSGKMTSLPRIMRPMTTQLFERRNHQLAGTSEPLLVSEKYRRAAAVHRRG